MVVAPCNGVRALCAVVGMAINLSGHPMLVIHHCFNQVLLHNFIRVVVLHHLQAIEFDINV